MSLTGLRPARPNRSSNRLEPTLTVTVRPSAGISGPSTSLSDGRLAYAENRLAYHGRDEAVRSVGLRMRSMNVLAVVPVTMSRGDGRVGLLVGRRGQHTGLMGTVEWV